MTAIRVMLYDPQAERLRTGGEELLAERVAAGDGWLWVDLEGVDKTRERELLMQRFGVSELALQDAQRDRHPPKLEPFDDHLFMLLRELAQTSTDEEPAVIQLTLFVGERFLVTRRGPRSAAVDTIWQEASEGALPLARGPGHLAFRLCRHLVDGYTDMVLRLEVDVGQLEDEMFERPSDTLLESLSWYNRVLKKLRRNLVYQHGMMAQLTRGELGSSFKLDRHEFNDIAENMERLASLCQLNQELAVDLMNTYLSLTSHRLNQIMRVLTITAVIFLPLTLVAGIYGMNFAFIPELSWRFGYFVVLGVMIGLATFMIVAFRRMRWL